MKLLTNIHILLALTFLVSKFCLSQNKAITVSNETTSRYIENRYAFIVGNDHYMDKNISSLTSCRLDAERMANFLKSEQGFSISEEQTTILLDAKKEEVTTSLRGLLESVTSPKNSIIYFYYSGHGLPGSIVPIDFSKENPNSLISYDWILSEIEKYQIGAKVYVIDACYAGSIIDSKSITDYSNAFKEIFEQNDNGKAIAFTATTAFRVTPAGKHESLFTKFLLDALTTTVTDTNNDTVISSGELFASLEKTLGVSNSPQFSGITNFPMAMLKKNRKNQQSIVAPQNEIAPPNTNIIAWVNFVKENRHDDVIVQNLINELEQETSTLSKAKLGYLYSKGIGVIKNEKKALTYLIPASSEQDSFAQYNLGHMYSKGIQFDSDKSKAFTFYTMAANNGNPFAQHNLGSYYYQKSKKVNTEENMQLAINWYLKSAKQNLPESQTALGILYAKLSKNSKQKSQKQKFKKLALLFYQKAATQEFAYGQYQLARYYKKLKENDTKKEELATYWFKRSCSNSYLRACSVLLQDTSKK